MPLFRGSPTNPAPRELLAEMARWKLAGHKIILATTGKKPLGGVIPWQVLGAPCRIVREASREEYIIESQHPADALADSLRPNQYFYEIEALD